jgi:uncharacterized surface protein with fasciclin (FAS1) repeats
MKTSLSWAVAPVLALALAGCGERTGEKSAAAAPEPVNRTIVQVVAGEGDLDNLEAATNAAGLDGVLGGVGPYTVFAPVNAAFAPVGDLSDEALKAQTIALLRDHIVPGALTRADIGKAIDQAGADGVKMRTMSDGLLTFVRDGTAIVVTTPDGARARLTGDETIASNGVVQPVDAMLVKAPAAAAAPTG